MRCRVSASDRRLAAQRADPLILKAAPPLFSTDCRPLPNGLPSGPEPTGKFPKSHSNALAAPAAPVKVTEHFTALNRFSLWMRPASHHWTLRRSCTAVRERPCLQPVNALYASFTEWRHRPINCNESMHSHRYNANISARHVTRLVARLGPVFHCRKVLIHVPTQPAYCSRCTADDHRLIVESADIGANGQRCHGPSAEPRSQFYRAGCRQRPASGRDGGTDSTRSPNGSRRQHQRPSAWL
jgi:hypothetical protein